MLFVFRFSPVCSFEKVDNLGFGALQSERIKGEKRIFLDEILTNITCGTVVHAEAGKTAESTQNISFSEIIAK